MVKWQFKAFAVFFVLLLLFFLLIYKQFILSKSSFDESLSLQSLSQKISVLSLELASHQSQLDDRQQLSAFLQQLDANPDILHWQLRKNANVIIEKQFSNSGESNTIKHVSYIPDGHGEVLSLSVDFIKRREPASILGIGELVSIAAISLLVLAFLIWKFHWLFDLERLALSQFEQPQKIQALPESLKHNIIARMLLRLTKLNQSLVEDKNTLTEQIRKTSYVDQVTELGNKAFFKAEFQVRLFHHDSPESGLLILFSFVDSDYEGDNILDDERCIQIAGVLKKFSQSYSDALVARLSHSDFVLLTPNQAEKDVDILCRKIVSQLEKVVFDNTKVTEHFVDIGISAYKQGFDYYKVLAEADMALRNAQLQGGNSWFMFGEALPINKVRGQLKWRSFLQRVLDKRQLQLYGQRIVYFDEDKTEHHEVYSRIEDGKDILTADTFLPMASRCGLAADFDRQVVDGLIKHCLHSSQNIANHKFAINLFISSLLDERFVGWLIGKLSSFPELCRHFVFEIKESQILENSAELKSVMEQLNSLGTSWCVDRFGEPDADLSYLQDLPIAMVKVDRRVIHQISFINAQQLLLNSILIQLKNLNIQVIVEGVEEASDHEYLASLDIKGAQGFYYAKPRRLGGIEKMLKVI